MFDELFDALQWSYFFLSAILFLIGVYLGPAAAEKEITFLLKYPRWMFRLMARYFRTNRRFIILFLIIFTLNNISLFSGFISGFLIVLPPLAAFFTGFNVAVISYEMIGWKGIWHILVNPVAWLEFPAAWISFALGLQLAETQFRLWDWSKTFSHFETLLPIYLKYVLVLLFIAGVLETALIVLANRFQDLE